MKQFKGFMKGINLGGWLSQCGDKYNDEHYSTFITIEDIKEIVTYGVDHVRLPIDYNVIQNEDGTFIESGFGYIDKCLEWCNSFGCNIVIDLHKTCGFVFDDASYNDFFTNEALQEQFMILWEELARRYGDLDYVAFELLNEVTEPRMAKPWNEIIKKTVPRIRAIAPDVPIIVGGIYNSSIAGLPLMEAPCTHNMVYTFHCYSPFIFTHQAAPWIASMPEGYSTTYPKLVSETREESAKVFGMDYDDEFEGLPDKLVDKDYFLKMFHRATAVAEKYDVPLYCGEYGVIDRAPAEDTLTWYKDIHAALAELKIARCAWTYKTMDFGITQEHLESIYEELTMMLGECV